MLPALCLIPLVALLRVLIGWHTPPEWLLGASPLAAVALCAGVYLPRRWSLIIPLGILLCSDWVIDWHYGAGFWSAALLGRYLLLALIAAAGMALQAGRRRGFSSPAVVLGGTALGSIGFYLGSIVLTWAGSVDYAHNFGGLIQALTLGQPGYPPSYLFLRNALVSDLLYSTVFMACVRLQSVPAQRRHGGDAVAAA